MPINTNFKTCFSSWQIRIRFYSGQERPPPPPQKKKAILIGAGEGPYRSPHSIDEKEGVFVGQFSEELFALKCQYFHPVHKVIKETHLISALCSTYAVSPILNDPQQGLQCENTITKTV